MKWEDTRTGAAGHKGAEAPLRAFDAAIFDLDGVVTDTAQVHAAAWKRLFDDYLSRRAESQGEAFRPFDIDADYPRYVDGKPRYEGVASFLASRGITLERGEASDSPARETVCGLGNRKNRAFLESLRKEPVEVFDTTVAFIRGLRQRGMKTAMVSSSRNAMEVLEAAGLSDLFDAFVDGKVADRLGLKGKPEPDTFLKAAEELGANPRRTMVLEDAISGVQAGRGGDFGLVVGIDRTGQAAALEEAGADIVVADVGELEIQWGEEIGPGPAASLPDALDRSAEIARMLEAKRVAVFLDYDGTLTPIVGRPDLAILSDAMRESVRELASICTVAVVSGRDRGDVKKLVGLDELIYAGSHGFDISGPEGLRVQHEAGQHYVDVVARAAELLRRKLAAIDGALVEPKKTAVAVHYRQVPQEELPAVENVVDGVLRAVPELRKTHGKKVFELRPRLDWDKGKAILWILRALEMDGNDVLPVYLGDDITDEDAFAVLVGRGLGIVVGRPDHPTHAAYVLDGPEEVRRFLRDLTQRSKGRPHE